MGGTLLLLETLLHRDYNAVNPIGRQGAGRQNMDEGQQIALSILAAEPGAWDRFYSTYDASLRRRAEGLRRSLPSLRNRYEASDLTQDFLQKKVLPPSKWDRMFRPVAAGEKPLWPLLAASLRNHCLALNRRLANRGREGTLPPDPVDPTPPTPSPQGFASRVLCFLQAIRQALSSPPPGTVAFGHLLLLSVRLELFPLVAGMLRCDDGTMPEGDPVPLAVEQLSPWTPAEEQQQLLPDSPLTLVQTWQGAVALAQVPFFKVSNAQLAGILGIPVNTLNQYRKRARLKMLAFHGPDVFSLFASE